MYLADNNFFTCDYFGYEDLGCGCGKEKPNICGKCESNDINDCSGENDAGE